MDRKRLGLFKDTLQELRKSKGNRSKPQNGIQIRLIPIVSQTFYRCGILLCFCAWYTGHCYVVVRIPALVFGRFRVRLIGVTLLLQANAEIVS